MPVLGITISNAPDTVHGCVPQPDATSDSQVTYNAIFATIQQLHSQFSAPCERDAFRASSLTYVVEQYNQLASIITPPQRTQAISHELP